MIFSLFLFYDTTFFSSYFFPLSVHSFVSFMSCPFFSFFLSVLNRTLFSSHSVHFPWVILSISRTSITICILITLNFLSGTQSSHLLKYTLFYYTFLSHWDVLSWKDSLCHPVPQHTHTRLQWLRILDLGSLNWIWVWLCSLLSCNSRGKRFLILICKIVNPL